MKLKFLKETLWDFVLMLLVYGIGLLRWSFEELQWPFIVGLIVFGVIETANYFKWYRDKT